MPAHSASVLNPNVTGSDPHCTMAAEYNDGTLKCHRKSHGKWHSTGEKNEHFYSMYDVINACTL